MQGKSWWMKFSHRGLHRTSEDERTVKTAHLKPVCSNGPYTAEGFRRTGSRRISSWPGDISTNRPDTLTQTFFIHQLFPCIHTADHTFGNFIDPDRIYDRLATAMKMSFSFPNEV